MNMPLYKIPEIMKKILLILILIPVINPVFAQENESSKHIVRVLFINPGIEYEYSLTERSKISGNIGYGLLPSYPNTTAEQPKNTPMFAPFFDIHYKFIYNRNKRKAANKDVSCNAGDFFGIKAITRGQNFDNGLVRTDKVDFSVGPTWGVQRTYHKISLLFDIGPKYYFDRKGNTGFYPVMFELNIGYVLKK